MVRLDTILIRYDTHGYGYVKINIRLQYFKTSVLQQKFSKNELNSNEKQFARNLDSNYKTRRDISKRVKN
jgi:hypothetical protein